MIIKKNKKKKQNNPASIKMQGTAWLDDIFPRSSGNLPANSIGIDQIKAKAMKSGQKTLSPIFFFFIIIIFFKNFLKIFIISFCVQIFRRRQPDSRQVDGLFYYYYFFNSWVQSNHHQPMKCIDSHLNEWSWLIGRMKNNKTAGSAGWLFQYPAGAFRMGRPTAHNGLLLFPHSFWFIIIIIFVLWNFFF